MPLFVYSGFDAAGKKVAGEIEATGRRAALQLLRSRGVYPSDLKEQTAPAEGAAALSFLRHRVPAQEMAVAVRQLATLLGSSLALDEALAIVGAQLEHKLLAKAFQQAREEVLQGTSLSEALSQSSLFPPLIVNMVQVGESSGTLDQVLARLADFLEEQARIRSKVRAALAYPVLMALVGCGVLFFLLAFVVPKVTRMLEDLEMALPLPTRLLLTLSDFLAAYWPLLLGLLMLTAWLAHRYRRSERGRLALDRRVLTLPLVGRLNLFIATARLSRTLSTLLASGVHLVPALEIVQSLMENRILQQALAETALAVREGEGLAGPLGRTKVFPPMVVQMAAVGERSGDLETMLLRVADTYDHQVESSIGGLLSLLEPLMILLMGAVVGFVVLAVLLPIFQASQGLG